LNKKEKKNKVDKHSLVLGLSAGQNATKGDTLKRIQPTMKSGAKPLQERKLRVRR